MKIITGQGFDANEAFANRALFEINYNATISWQKAGKPLGEELKRFAEDYLKKKFKSTSGIGCYIVVESPIKDTREKPYKVKNIISTGRREWTTYYLPIETETGNPVPFSGELPENKTTALTLVKELVTTTRKNITIEVVKKVTTGSPIAAIVSYSPSVNTKIGSYIFFGYERE